MTAPENIENLEPHGARMDELEVNSQGSAEIVVSESDLASSLSREPQDSFPPVLATARVVALMETAAARVLRPILQQGELSVGVTVEITHSAATRRGAKVKATARYLGREGKLFKFEVLAEDGAGEIGRGTHKRAIVSAERLVSGALKRNPPDQVASGLVDAD